MTTSPALPLAVITVTYSPGEYLRDLLDSLNAATTRRTIVIMADNGSTDGAPQAAVSESVELLHTGGNIGYGAAINAAARNLEGRRHGGEVDPEFFLFVNPDVQFSPGSIDELIACAKRHPTAAAIGPRIVEPDGSTYPSARAVPTLRTGIGHALLAPVWPNNPWSRAYRNTSDMNSEFSAGWLSGSCQLMRWEAFDSLGGFDERYFMYMEDVDLGDRAGRRGYQNVYCPRAQIVHAQGHSADVHYGLTHAAHHDSAYRFQADRLTGWRHAPIRLVLRVGLTVREFLGRILHGNSTGTQERRNLRLETLKCSRP